MYKYLNNRRKWSIAHIFGGIMILFFSETSCAGGEQPKNMRFLALGDSYTIGESVPALERWPVLLANLLRQKKKNISDPLIIAKTGWTTDELMAAIDKENPQGTFDLVTLLIGVNNQYRGYSTKTYSKEFTILLQRAIKFANNKPDRVIVLSIPDWGITPFAKGRDRSKIAKEIDVFNNINREITKQLGALYVDITPISRKFPKMIANDGLHPSGEMYKHWAKETLPVALKQLSNMDKE